MEPRILAQNTSALKAIALRHEPISLPNFNRRPMMPPDDLPAPQSEPAFSEVLSLIQTAKQRAYQAVNTELVNLYWQVGEYISLKVESAEWGDAVTGELARYLAKTQPGLRGFTRASLFRMRQFFECYRHNAIVAPLVRQLPWSHNLIILSASKRDEEREFYIRLAIHEKWTKHELEHQIRGGRFEHTILEPVKVPPAVSQLHPDAVNIFKGEYSLEFQELSDTHPEAYHNHHSSRVRRSLLRGPTSNSYRPSSTSFINCSLPLKVVANPRKRRNHDSRPLKSSPTRSKN
jgi:predicted nuclease of restriction endonuclease-like (RecB) superfamily